MTTANESNGGRRALVTGSNGGIGSAVVELLSERGFEVITLDISAPAELQVDLAGDELPIGIFETVDVCISNAAITNILSPAHRMSAEKWDRDLAVNLTGAFRVMQACYRGMIERGYGRIVGVSSMAAKLGTHGQIAYAASKAGLLGVLKTFAAEGAAHGVTANAVLPGMIETDAVRAMPPDVRKRVDDVLHPAPRMGTTAEAASLIAFLASEESGYVSGQEIAVDGGMTLNRITLGSPRSSR
ncbi:MAG: SDR family oxidoreductase [Actinomycetota bacterium]|nr:SDR family oxidoreductase [Actinomycetota bacterium]